MLRNNATAAAVGSIVILVATACGTSTDRSSIDSTTTVAPSVTAPSTTQAESSSTVERSVESRALILALAGPQLGGGTFDPQSVAGREVLLWFWAPW